VCDQLSFAGFDNVMLICFHVLDDGMLNFCLQKFVHELRITNQVMYLNPPVEEVRVNIMGELFAWEANIMSLSRITHARYQAISCRLVTHLR